jgi:uroporphyrinogen-III synthase
MLDGKLVVVTRASDDSAHVKNLLEKTGARVYELPTIKFEALATRVDDLSGYTHVVFTSSHAVDFFMRATSSPIPRYVQVAARGDVTKEKLTSYGVAAKNFADVTDWQSANVLLPRSQLATDELPQELRDKGAKVTTIALYLTLYVDERDAKFEELLAGGKVGCITFTSPSSIAGFGHRLAGSQLTQSALNLPAACIGRTTAAAAKKAGFKNILVSKENSAAGLVETLNEINDQ